MVEVNKEIEEMLNGLGDPTPKNVEEKEEEEEEVEEKSEEKEEKEEKSLDKEEEKEEKEEEKEDKEEEKEEKRDEGEKEEEEEEDKDKTIEDLRRQLNEKTSTKEEKKEEKKEEPLKLDEQDFIGDLDLEDLTTNKEKLNKLLNAVYIKGVGDSKKISTEGVLTAIPDIVKHNVTLISTLREAREDFYKKNKDLAPYQNMIASIFEEFASKNPDKKYGEILDLVAPEARKRLALHKKAVETDKNNKEEERRKPRLPNAKGGQRSAQGNKPDTSSLSKEIGEMNKSLGR